VTYAIGPRHTLVGSGQVGLASPIGLKLQVPAVPISVDERFGHPMQIYGAGFLTLGNADGWFEVLPLRHQAQLELGFDPQPTLLGYDLVDGVTLVADELVAVPPAVTLSEVWQRNPAPTGGVWVGWNPAGSPTTTMGVVTVPAGRRLMLTSARVQLVRLGAAPAPSSVTAACTFTLDGVSALAVVYLSGPSLFVFDQVVGPVFLAPGNTFRATYINQEAAGGCYAVCTWAGTYFDV
jgi:hypothetical protein